LSVRGQHPYRGPTGTALVVFYGLVIVVSVAGGVLVKRAATGVSGAAVRQQRAQAAAVAAAYIRAVVFQGALHYLAVSNTIVYGVYPASAALTVAGAAVAAIGASRQNWPPVRRRHRGDRRLRRKRVRRTDRPVGVRRRGLLRRVTRLRSRPGGLAASRMTVRRDHQCDSTR
jgi:hypothetical protein